MVFSFSRAALPVPDASERAFASATLRTILSAAWVFGPSVGAAGARGGTSFTGLFLVRRGELRGVRGHRVAHARTARASAATATR